MLITSMTPHLDLHGEITSMAKVLVNEFIKDNFLMHNKYVVIIHGKSTNILTEEVHKILKENKYVKTFKKNNWNPGETYIELDI